MSFDASEPKAESVPHYWGLLTPSEQRGYAELRASIAGAIEAAGRSKFCRTFYQIVEKMENYIKNDGTRSLVCGYLSFGERISINTRQLTLLIGKCKSSINCGFQSIGFYAEPINGEITAKLMEMYPFMKSNFAETRQWTVRRKIDGPKRQIFKKKPKTAQDSGVLKATSPQPAKPVDAESHPPEEGFTGIDIESDLPILDSAFIFDAAEAEFEF